MSQPPTSALRSNAFSPFAYGLFALIWTASVLGNTGSFIRDVASAWLVTGLSDNPAAVALMQTAATLPVFLLALPAGAMTGLVGVYLLGNKGLARRPRGYADRDTDGVPDGRDQRTTGDTTT